MWGFRRIKLSTFFPSAFLFWIFFNWFLFALILEVSVHTTKKKWCYQQQMLVLGKHLHMKQSKIEETQRAEQSPHSGLSLVKEKLVAILSRGGCQRNNSRAIYECSRQHTQAFMCTLTRSVHQCHEGPWFTSGHLNKHAEMLTFQSHGNADIPISWKLLLTID